MRLRDSIALKRTICGLVMGTLTLGMMLFHTSQNASNYLPDLRGPEVLQSAVPVGKLGTVEEPADSRQKMTISFLGNCLVGSMLGSDAYGTFNEMILSEGPDYFLAGAVDLLETDDWTVAALGSVFSDSVLSPAEKEDGELTWYRSSSEGALVLSEGSVDVVSLATDHTMDYGKQGYEDTKAALEKVGIAWGDDEKALYLEKYGICIGVYACSLEEPETDPERIRSWIRNAKSKCDLVVVYPHGHMGMEPDDASLFAEYCSFVDAGADLVLATHSRTLYEPVSYGNGVIMPSLGSFLSGDNRFPELVTGVFQLHMLCDGDTLESWSWELVPYLAYMEPWQPIPDPNP